MPPRPTGPLRALELATAAVMATVAAVLTVAGWFLPHLGAIASLAVVPFGVVGHRHRLRAVMASVFATSVVSFLVAGTGSVSNVVACGCVGGLIGISKRRGWGLWAVMVGVAVIGPVLAGVSIGLLALFSSLRRLVLKQFVNTWHGVRRTIDALGDGLHRMAGSLSRSGVSIHTGISVPTRHSHLSAIDDVVTTLVRDWWIAVAVTVIAGIAWLAALGWLFLGGVLDRLQWVRGQDRLDAGEEPPPTAPPHPVPVRLEDVSFRYPGSERPALQGVSARVDPAEMVAVVGDNGSGKSTLTRLLAGRPPTEGSVDRPGPAGLGRIGGTAVVLQQPESSVLGVRVADDVVWGLHDAAGVDVTGLLARVGLAGMEARETAGLSGGELQRLAVAAALARRPALLISDESTAMVDEAGRELMVGLLRDLADQDGIAVVHVTHRDEEAARADRLYRLREGRLVHPGAPAPVAAVEADPAAVGPLEPQVLAVERVSHTYAVGTPWARPALDGVDLRVEPGEGVLVVGGNGSGKSTLAWVMAGLLRPTLGRCCLGGEAVHESPGKVALAFQHARLQLQRATVGRDVRSAGAADDAAVGAALRSVGLDPARFAERRVDELSGGEQRRVALAGLLARRPAVLLLDEPLAGLDGPSREGLTSLLGRLRTDCGLTLVVISHDMSGMDRMCERVVRLDAGRVVADTALSGVGS